MSRTTTCTAVVTALGVVGLDQLAKQAAINLGPGGWNEPGTTPGLSLGLASSSTAVPTVAAISGLVMGGVALAWVARHHPRLVGPLALVVGGAFSNMLDRPLRGGVVDFV